MTETTNDRKRSSHHSKPKAKPPGPSPISKLLRLLLKQTLTAILCAALVLGIHNMAGQPFSGYADALGQALRYEINLSKIKESGFGVLHWLSNRFSQETEMNSHE